MQADVTGLDVTGIPAAKPLFSAPRSAQGSTASRKPKAAPFLPMSRAEMEALGWDECDIIIVTGDA